MFDPEFKNLDILFQSNKDNRLTNRYYIVEKMGRLLFATNECENCRCSFRRASYWKIVLSGNNIICPIARIVCMQCCTSIEDVELYCRRWEELLSSVYNWKGQDYVVALK